MFFVAKRLSDTLNKTCGSTCPCVISPILLGYFCVLTCSLLTLRYLCLGEWFGREWQCNAIIRSKHTIPVAK